jgi:hypothetical protein
MSGYGSALRKSLRWYKKLGVEFILGKTVVNAWVIYNQFANKKTKMTKFREDIIRALFAEKDNEDGVPERQVKSGTPTPTPGKIKTSQSSKQETSTFLTPKMQERPMKKRKAAASPSPNEDRAGNSNQRVMDRLVAQVGKLSKIVGDAYHPKKDLKAVAQSLVSLVAQLRVCNTPQESEEEASKEAERQKRKSDKAEGKPKEEVEKKETTTQTPAE